MKFIHKMGLFKKKALKNLHVLRKMSIFASTIRYNKLI